MGFIEEDKKNHLVLHLITFPYFLCASCDHFGRAHISHSSLTNILIQTRKYSQTHKKESHRKNVILYNYSPALCVILFALSLLFLFLSKTKSSSTFVFFTKKVEAESAQYYSSIFFMMWCVGMNENCLIGSHIFPLSFGDVHQTHTQGVSSILRLFFQTMQARDNNNNVMHCSPWKAIRFRFINAL